MFQFGQIIGAPIVVGSIDSISEVLIQEGQASFSGYVCISNVHMVTTAKKNVALRSAMDAAMVNTSDGMPLVWGLRMQGFNQAQRVSGPDLMIKICEKAQSSNTPVYFYGGSPSVVEVMKKKLAECFPDLIIAGIQSPPILPDQPEVDPKVVGKIKNSGAKIVFVGFGGGLTWGAFTAEWSGPLPSERKVLHGWHLFLARIRSVLLRIVRVIEGLIWGRFGR